MTFTILRHHLCDFVPGHLVMQKSVVFTSLAKKKKADFATKQVAASHFCLSQAASHLQPPISLRSFF